MNERKLGIGGDSVCPVDGMAGLEISEIGRGDFSWSWDEEGFVLR